MILRVIVPMMVRMTMRMVVRTFVSRGWRLGGFCSNRGRLCVLHSQIIRSIAFRRGSGP